MDTQHADLVQYEVNYHKITKVRKEVTLYGTSRTAILSNIHNFDMEEDALTTAIELGIIKKGDAVKYKDSYPINLCLVEGKDVYTIEDYYDTDYSIFKKAIALKPFKITFELQALKQCSAIICSDVKEDQRYSQEFRKAVAACLDTDVKEIGAINLKPISKTKSKFIVEKCE